MAKGRKTKARVKNEKPALRKKKVSRPAPDSLAVEPASYKVDYEATGGEIAEGDGETNLAKRPGVGFPVVGIGASAGGLDAFTRLLSHLPLNTGMSFVLIQHLDPKHESMSAEILSRVTKMPVTEVKDGDLVQSNSICIIPPGFSMEISGGVLKLALREEGLSPHLVIDRFLKSLAEDQRALGIGVVLSGTGTDGTYGLRAIKAEGGITLAQKPESAKFDSMPQSAIASGAVDIVLNPEEIAKELARIARHPYISPAARSTPEASVADRQSKHQDVMTQIFLLLRKHCHVDFSFYKTNTVRRRIERRMVLQKADTLRAYAEFLAQNPVEVKALYADILIHVTGFFRDPEGYAALKTEVFPNLMKNRLPGNPIRVWIAGCSTGEEAYSIAISLLEFLADKASHVPIQIFASDVSEQAIQKARLGEYLESISATVSAERLSRYFVKLDGGGYRIARAIRDICVFSRHDISTDPPFAKIDFLSCRNLLIYFSSSLQRHVIPIFHYSLVENGYLWLGMSETIGSTSERFSAIDKTHKIYLRKDAPTTVNLHFPSSTYVYGKQEMVPERRAFAKVTLDVQRIAEQTIQAEYPGVLVNDEMEILEVRGRTAPFIELVAGVPSFHLLKMAHPEILRELRATIQDARKLKCSVRKENLSLGDGRSLKTFNLNVIPIQHPQNPREILFLVLFETIKLSKAKIAKEAAIAARKNRTLKGKKDPYVLELKHEISELQELQRTLEDRFEATQQDLTAANEELQSANEELQSTNEEMETAKEELQSGNEELTTVNEELQTRSIQQAQANNDLINLLGSVEIPIVMLGDDHKVRRFTPLAGKALNLITTDVGRPLSDLKLNFISPAGEINLHQMVSATIGTMVSQEVEVQDQNGHWFRLQVRPYKTVDNGVDGAVLALVDIHDLKLSLKEVREAKRESEKANRAKDLFLATLSHELRTPLTSILSWAQLLRSRKLDAEKSKRALEIIEENGRSQAQLINDLLDISRIISGKLALEPREIDPISAVLGAVEAVRPTAEAKSIEIDLHFAKQVGTVFADPVRIQQVFWNLLTNAVKFSAPHSKVIINVERVSGKDGDKARALIRVEDSGKGIEREFLPQIFDRFSQEDNSSIRVHGGLGLGLAIVKDIVELHGGTIHAESLGEGLGASFTVMLPIKSDQVSADAQCMSRELLKNPVSSGGFNANLNGVRVLLVDDEATALEAFSELLSSMGAEVTAARTAKDALVALSQFRPHVLVSDIAMPGEDGYSLMKQVRALGHKAGGATPAMALTAYASEEDIRLAMAAGFQLHMSKPVDGQELAKKIAKLAKHAADS